MEIPASHRITMLAAALSRSGGGVYGAILGQSHALARLGTRISLVGLADEHSEADRPVDASMDVMAVPAFGRRALRIAPGLDRALGESGADLVHLHGLWTQPSVSLSAWRRQTARPTVISPHGMLDPWALRNSRWKKRIAELAFERANLAAASCLHALNHSEAEAIRRFGLANPIAVIPNGVDLPEGSAMPAPPVGHDQRRRLLYLGRLHPKKGLPETIRAWALLRERAPEIRAGWRLVVAGWDDGGHAERFQALAAELGLADEIEFTGPLFGEAKKHAFCEASGFILASHSEGLPMAVLEAWAYSLPVFMTQACNLPEGFTACAAVEVAAEPEALAQVLGTQLGREDLATIGRRGRELVERSFSWNSVARRHAAVYDWLISGGPKPDDVRLS